MNYIIFVETENKKYVIDINVNAIVNDKRKTIISTMHEK